MFFLRRVGSWLYRVGRVISGNAVWMCGVLVFMGISFSGVAEASHDFLRYPIESGGNANSAREIKAVDMDNDGDSDVVTAARFANEFAWYERDDADSTSFTRHVIDSGIQADGALDIESVDFDGDGDMDVVTVADATFVGTPDTFAWYEQDDADPTNFTRHIIIAGPPALGAEDIEAVDFDGDGNMDVVTAAESDTFAWYENDGSNTSFTEHPIEVGANANLARDIEPVDFDGDGDMDVVTTAGLADEFAWYENDGSNTSFIRHVIESGAGANGPQSIRPVDVDGDGDTDVATAAGSAGEFAWYERDDADSTSFTRHVIDSGMRAEGAHKNNPADVDGDGDMDFVTAAVTNGGESDTFAWYENDGTHTSFTQHVIVSGAGDANGASGVVPVDFDDDGFVDVVTAAKYADEFAWYESPMDANGGSSGGGGGGGRCVIERTGLSDARLEFLRDLRDVGLNSSMGRLLTSVYYRWFGRGTGSHSRP